VTSPAVRPAPTRARAPAVRRALALTAVGGLLSAGIAIGVATSAAADPTYPSAKQVEQAKGAVGAASRSVAALEAQLAVASARLDQLQTQVQVAAEAYDLARIETGRTEMITRLASLKKTSVRLETQRQQGLEEAARRRAEARRRAAAEAEARRERERRASSERARTDRTDRSGRGDSFSSSGSSDTGGGSSQGSSSAGAAAVAWAKTQLGKDYEWGADGPSTYDCSGLTLQAWARQGVSLPHSSVLQYSVTKHVSISSLRVGDLVFFATDTSNPGTIHHVALYAGGGQMVEAPYTGAQVRISSIYRSGLMPYAGRP
jgi:peptidoglycan DL-endopeptidase CwlO